MGSRAARPSALVHRPLLWGRLAAAARVTVLSAPAGSGKTVLLRSWLAEAGLADRVACVSVGRDERDPQRFWLPVLGALRGTTAGSALIGGLSAAPEQDGWAIVERLLTDLAALDDRRWLVIDDLHELSSAEARRQLELLMMRSPPELRFVLATRHDVRLGLHRLRLEGELTELRGDDLKFAVPEARELLAAAGLHLADATVSLLVKKTEGWAAGLRLAALSLAGHPDPGRFAAEFSGTERTVAEYLLAEVLERQSEPVRRLLLRTSMLERVSGELADRLTGGSGGEAVLQNLEEVNAFTVSLDTGRTWFRYHRLFAAGRALEQSLDLAEPDGRLLWFLLYPAPGLLERHARRGTGHAAMVAEILGLLAPSGPRPTATVLGALLPVLGVGLFASFLAYYWLPVSGELGRPRPRAARARSDDPGQDGCDNRASGRTGSNSSTGLPDGSSAKVCLPPTPVTISFRNRTPLSRSRLTVASRSGTSIAKRFQPPGSGRLPSGIAWPPPGPVPAALSSRRRSPSTIIANAGAGCITSVKPRLSR